MATAERHRAAQLARLASLIASSPHNLVSRGERAAIASVHVPEALAVGAVLDAAPGQRWLDLGTGGGLPGLVLAIACPRTDWVLLDSTAKKTRAVREFAGALGLENVETVTARAELAAHDPDHRGRYDGVVARAVAPLPTLVELARGFVRAGGTLAAIKGPAWQDEVAAAAAALRILRWTTPTATHVTSAARPTWLVTMQAQGAPPRGFPRRVGVPRHEPLRRG
jgi:16S rRNA (guanine527-N7)-methyltransferase